MSPTRLTTVLFVFVVMVVSGCATNKTTPAGSCAPDRTLKALPAPSSSTLLHWPAIVRWGEKVVIAGTNRVDRHDAELRETFILSVDTDGTVEQLARVEEMALQLIVDTRGLLHVFGVTGFDPSASNAKRMELWHTTYDGKVWTERETLLEASSINWPVGIRAVTVAPDNSMHVAVAYADSDASFGIFYLKRRGGAWSNAIVFNRGAALATIAAMPNEEVVIAFFRGNRRTGDTNNVYALTVDASLKASEPVLVHKSGSLPALTASLQPLGANSVRLVFGQRAEDLTSLAIKHALSRDSGRTWGPVQSDLVVAHPIRTVIGVNSCGESVVVAQKGSERGIPEVATSYQGVLEPLPLDGAVVTDLGAHFTQSGELLLVTSEFTGAGRRWVIRSSRH